MVTGPGAKKCGSANVGSAPKSVSLTVLPEAKKKHNQVAKSKVSKWRAAVLISVNLLMLAHIGQWIWSQYNGSGRTISPVEPSESMYTIEVGQVNAGFVFFSLALLSTFIFGRFFCGWGCHIVSLQDLCSHWMNKIGVRPKPFRSRLLLLAPLMLALYMFVWPTFKRLAVLPLEGFIAQKVKEANPDRLRPWTFPEWLIDLPRAPHPGFKNAFVVDDFWHTFPSEWYVIVPFLFVCGFAAVYFLGSKGFCTYGCPYGGFFAPLDKISIGRIVVNDKCEGCGHCTAVCTSNVRVAQEVHDFGMVMDPGCMKCLDCVSVCPNDALSFSFAKPAILTSARTEEAKQGKSRKPDFDLTWWQDIVLLALVILCFIGFRQMFNKIPLLMAAGMGLAAGFIAWKMWTLVTEPNVRLQSLQLKLKGKLKPWGIVLLLLGTAYLGWGGWGLANQVVQSIANYHDLKVLTPSERVFAEGYKPSEIDRANAEKAIKYLKLAGPFSEGGMGWPHGPQLNLRLAWHSAVAANFEDAEKYLRRAIDQGTSGAPTSPQWVFQLARIMQIRGKSQEQITADLHAIVDQRPYLYPIKLAFAEEALIASNPQRAAEIAESLFEKPGMFAGSYRRMPEPESALKVQAAHMLIRAGKMEQGTQRLEEVLSATDPEPDLNTRLNAADVYLQVAKPDAAAAIAEKVLATSASTKADHPSRLRAIVVLLRAGKSQPALARLDELLASTNPPPDAVALATAGDILLQTGNAPKAEATFARAVTEFPQLAFTHFQYARALAYANKGAQALEQLRIASELEPHNPQYLGARAELLQAMGRTEEAAKLMQQAQQLLNQAPAGPSPSEAAPSGSR